MSDKTQPLYEGMFLLNMQTLGGDFHAGLNHVRDMLERAEAEVLSLRRWDERKLAFTIRGHKRGTYVYSLFRVNGNQIVNIERDCNLSDQILRAMILRADHMGDIEIEMELKAESEKQLESKLHEEDDATAASTDDGSGHATPAAPSEDTSVDAEADTVEAASASSDEEKPAG